MKAEQAERASVSKAKEHPNDSIVLAKYDEREDSFANMHLLPFRVRDNRV
jgi:hypothetical protein